LNRVLGEAEAHLEMLRAEADRLRNLPR